MKFECLSLGYRFFNPVSAFRGRCGFAGRPGAGSIVTCVAGKQILGDWAQLDMPRLQSFIQRFPHASALAALHFEASQSSAVICALCASGAILHCSPSFLRCVAASFASDRGDAGGFIVESSMIILLSECTVWAQQWGSNSAGSSEATDAEASHCASAALVGGLTRGLLGHGGSGGGADRGIAANDVRLLRVLCGAARGADGALKKGDTGQGRAPLFAAPVRKLALLSQLQVPFSPRGNGRDTAWRLLDRAGWRGATREKGDAEASERMRRTLRLRARRGERRRAGPPRRPPGGFSAGTSTRPRGFRTHKDSSTSRRRPARSRGASPSRLARGAPPPPFRTKWTRRVHHLVLIGHAPPPASFSQGGQGRCSCGVQRALVVHAAAGRRGCQGGRAGCGRRSS